MQSVMNHSFSKAPTVDIQRSSFDRSHGLKTTFDAGYLVPIFVDEAIPGDTFTMDATFLARLNTPIYPLMDNLFLDIHWFSCPMRLLWDNFRKFMGEQVNPGDSIDYTIPKMTFSNAIGTGSLADYFGIPIGGQPTDISALFFRAYYRIYNEWFRDQNLVDAATAGTTTTDNNTSIGSNGGWLAKRGKRHDYFTSCLPWLQKGDAVALPLGSSADIHTAVGQDVDIGIYSDGVSGYRKLEATGFIDVAGSSTGAESGKLYADLSTATASTVNELRQAFQIQKLLERDARSGTRYSEIVNAHFGVNFLDVTYRPEYLGGSSTPVNFDAVPSMNDGTRKLGDLAAYGISINKGSGFTKSFTEHCVVMGIASVRADLTYQQGIDRMFTRDTKYDFYWPALAHIGEQAVLNKEIYYQGTADDENVFGYQERFAEYKYKQSRITGKMRSAAMDSLDAWHLSQEFGSLPTLNETFIAETPPMDRVVAVTTEPDFTMDAYFKFNAVRPMPVYSVPGLIDHF